ncbi:MAG TPA: hypothetical protein VMR37_04260, partial [Rhabdochlamydiaceae bacterium]|nr:hypothetical protein [Rhabdochlamydiaceae bacterium]
IPPPSTMPSPTQTPPLIAVPSDREPAASTSPATAPVIIIHQESAVAVSNVQTSPTAAELKDREPSVTSNISPATAPPAIPSDILKWLEKNCAVMDIKDRNKVGRVILIIKQLSLETSSDLETTLMNRGAIIGLMNDKFASGKEKPLRAAVRAYFMEINSTQSPAFTPATEADILAWANTKSFSPELTREIVSKVQGMEGRPEYQKDPKKYILSLRGRTHDDTESKAIVYLSLRYDVLNPPSAQVSEAPVQCAPPLSPALIRATEAEISTWLSKRGASLSDDQKRAVILKVREIEHRSEYQDNPKQYILSQRSSRNHTEIESKAIAYLSSRHQVLHR